MQVSDNRCCFICGPDNPVGLKVKPHRDETAGRAWLTVVIPAEYQGWAGIAHGGIVGALLDEVSAYAGMAVSKQIVTAELNIRYLRPVPIGQEVTIEAQIREQVRRSVTVEAAMTCRGEVLARSVGRMVILKPAEAPPQMP
jgi:uncharacterized protein (TIGR00369 family)